MKIPAGIVGREVEPDEQRIDKRWLMAYNAALGELSEEAHPLFPVCYEWPATHALREATELQKINARLVHAQHDLVLHRKILSGDVVSVRAKVVAATKRGPGALVVFRLAATDGAGAPVSTTHYGMLYRGVTLEGDELGDERPEDPPKHEKPLQQIGEVAVAATAAHVYTECARIFNPIHTDVAYARAAGLPDIILHGTATLAFSTSKVISFFKLPFPRRIRCRFAGMVTMPGTLSVRASRVGDSVAFETCNAKGEAIIERGWIG